MDDLENHDENLREPCNDVCASSRPCSWKVEHVEWMTIINSQRGVFVVVAIEHNIYLDDWSGIWTIPLRVVASCSSECVPV